MLARYNREEIESREEFTLSQTQIKPWIFSILISVTYFAQSRIYNFSLDIVRNQKKSFITLDNSSP